MFRKREIFREKIMSFTRLYRFVQFIIESISKFGHSLKKILCEVIMGIKDNPKFVISWKNMNVTASSATFLKKVKFPEGKF